MRTSLRCGKLRRAALVAAYGEVDMAPTEIGAQIPGFNAAGHMRAEPIGNCGRPVGLVDVVYLAHCG